MCEICLHEPCDPRCPNADLPKVVLTCDKCGEDIYEGDEYYEDIDGECICESCMDKWISNHHMYAEAN